MPATHLIRTDLPAPLSPASAVTCPAGISRSTDVRACTGPNRFVTPRSRRRASAPSAEGPGGPDPTSDVTVPVAYPLGHKGGRASPASPRVRPDRELRT